MYLDFHTHKTYSDRDVIGIINIFPNEKTPQNYFSSGIHPWQIDTTNIEDELHQLNQNLQKQHCLALGECGLDKAIETDLEIQKDIFLRQLNLNKTYKKPVIIHSVRAHQEILQIQRKEKIDQTFIFHGFDKNEILLNQILTQKNHVSFGYQLKQKQNLKTIFANLSENELFLETDNAEISIQEMYSIAAEIRSISVGELQKIIQKNVEKLFNIKF